jgi:hypothetical protein
MTCFGSLQVKPQLNKLIAI